MLQTQYIRENKELVIQGLNKKHFKDAETQVEQVLERDQKRKNTQKELDEVLAATNLIAKDIGNLMKAGKKEAAEKLKEENVLLKNKAKDLEAMLKSVEDELTSILVRLPNVPHSSVPEGKLPEDNKIIFEYGSIPVLSDKAVSHWDLITKYDIIDFELGNKIAGAGFPVYKGKGARLQRALINFFLGN